MTVPVKHRHRIARTHTQGIQHIGGSRDSFVKRLVGQATMVRIDNLLIPMLSVQPRQQMPYK